MWICLALHQILLSAALFGLLISTIIFHRLSDVKSQTVPKDPSAASVYFVKILIDCLCVAPATEKELRNAVIEKCKISGVKSTTRGTVSGDRLSSSSLCCLKQEAVLSSIICDNTT